VPLSILFWPTMEQTIVSIIFLGAFFTVVLNVIGGVEAIDVSYRRAAPLDGRTVRGTSSGGSCFPPPRHRSSRAWRWAWG
jgi:hypothetical protein